MRSTRRVGYLLVLIAAMSALPGCRVFRHRGNAGCYEAQITTNTENRPALKVPAGLDAPDTGNAIHIPALTEPEQPRVKNAPCLSQPPSYVTTEAAAQPASRAGPDQPAR